MKKNIHPKYYNDAKITCVCGNAFTTGATMPEIKVEICSVCHPYFTGKQKLVDTARRVEKFNNKKAASAAIAPQKSKKVKEAARKEAKKQAEK
jgi:large subunit ribosomal protein L31